jgi:hypothetical protein
MTFERNTINAKASLQSSMVTSRVEVEVSLFATFTKTCVRTITTILQAT